MDIRNAIKLHGLKLAMGVVALGVAIPVATAVNLSGVVEIVDTFGNDVVPSIVNLVINLVPLRVVGIIVAFLGSILGGSLLMGKGK